LKLFFDPVRHQLIVHVFSACELSSNFVQKTTQYNACSSYCRIRLLPGRDEMKYSKMISDSNNPDWNQVFKFVDYTEQEIIQNDLELTVWNCEMDKNQQTLFGEGPIQETLKYCYFYYMSITEGKSNTVDELRTVNLGGVDKHLEQMKPRPVYYAGATHCRKVDPKEFWMEKTDATKIYYEIGANFTSVFGRPMD
ncbi:hypothetical protein AHF37_11274, partial [Paragonimus kellicotti]